MLSICNKCLTPLVLQVYIIPDTTLCFRKICIKPDTTLCILKYVFINTLQTFSLRQTDGEHIKSRTIYLTSLPSAQKVGKNVS